MKKKLKSTSALLQSLFDPEISTQIFHKITYNTFILARRAIKFLDLNFLYISKDKIKSKIGKPFR